MPFFRPQKPRDIYEAYAILEVEEGAPLEIVKSAYKKLSLRTHPDKNPDDPNATQEFQKISEAYRVLLKHLDNNSDSNESDYNDDHIDEEYLYELYRHLFEMAMRSEEHAFYARTHKYKLRKKEESPEKHRIRIQRHLDEQKAGEERRKRERLQLRARREAEREQERCEAEERQKTKNSDKKAAAKTQHQKDIETIRKRLEVSQKLRSAIFAAARKGNVERVKQGIWEEDVDAAGGELKDGCHGFVVIPPTDPQETLLHIAARRGDQDLVKWLDGHGAEPEERDSAGLTVFHVALQCGHIPIVKYFFEEHPPTTDTAKIYDLSSSASLLSFAIQSLEPELVWMILDKKLANKETMIFVWEGLAAESENLARKTPTKGEEINDIKRLLAHYGGFIQQSTSSRKKDPNQQASGLKPTVHSRIGKEPIHKTGSNARGPKQMGVNGRGRGRGGSRGPSFISGSTQV